jgi:hypothetical protein
VLVTFRQHSVRHPRLGQEPDAVALEDAGPHGLLDLAAGPVVDDGVGRPRGADQRDTAGNGPLIRLCLSSSMGSVGYRSISRHVRRT